MARVNIETTNVFDQISKNHIKVGDKLVFRAIQHNLENFDSSSLKAPLRIVSVVPSLATEVCKEQTQILSDLVESFDDVQLITISYDLPLECNRLSKGPKHPKRYVVSDYRYHDFGSKTGLMMKDFAFLCRAALVLDKQNILVYSQIANPATSSLDIKAITNFITQYNK